MHSAPRFRGWTAASFVLVLILVFVPWPFAWTTQGRTASQERSQRGEEGPQTIQAFALLVLFRLTEFYAPSAQTLSTEPDQEPNGPQTSEGCTIIKSVTCIFS